VASAMGKPSLPISDGSSRRFFAPGSAISVPCRASRVARLLAHSRFAGLLQGAARARMRSIRAKLIHIAQASTRDRMASAELS